MATKHSSKEIKRAQIIQFIRALFLLIVLIIIIIFLLRWREGQSPVSKQKAAILSLIAQSNQRTLTEKEKKAIFLDIKGNGINRYGFSSTEEQQLLQALNK